MTLIAHCPVLPRDCQIEILQMLPMNPLQLSSIQKQSRDEDSHHQKGFIVRRPTKKLMELGLWYL